MTSRNYPDFVRGFLAWFADGFLFEQGGTFPAQSHNTDPADKRWRRYADCHALLEGWLENDLKAALEAQAERLELVERVAQLRQQERDDSPGKAGRARAKATKTDGEVFADLEEWFGVKDYSLKRQHKKLTEHREYLSGTYPLALVQAGDAYEIKTVEVDKVGAVRLAFVAKPKMQRKRDGRRAEL